MRVGGQPAFLAIADVSGYTSYLAGVELDHATDILADLVGTVVEAMLPFRLSKLEGDAAFASLEGETVEASALQDCIEGTYVAFRRRLRDIKQASRCGCDACILIPDLDLKLVVHHGSVARQRMVGLEELVGADVILVHRLLKNTVTAETGIGAYALYTDAAVSAAGIDPVAQRLREHHEHTDVAGDVRTWVRDLGAVWQAVLDRPREEIPPEDVGGTWVLVAPVPVPVTWDYITSPTRRPMWTTGVSEIIEMSPDGRRGVGTTNHCLHGKDVVIERILDWQPPTSWLVRSSLPESMGGIDILMSDELTELPEGGTRVTLRVGRPTDVDPAAFAAVAAGLGGMLSSLGDRLNAILSRVAVEMARDAERELEIPTSRGRYLKEPVIGSTEGVARPSA